MKSHVTKYLKNTFPILKILKKENIFNFDHSVPAFFVKLTNELLWNVIYKAKLLSRCRRRRKIDIVDIRLAMILKYKKNDSYRVFSPGIKLTAIALGFSPWLLKKKKNGKFNQK